MSGRPDALAGAVRAEQAAMDWRAQLRADVDAVALAGDDAQPACSCPDGHGLCREDCDVCAALPDDVRCPADTYGQDDGDDAAEWRATHVQLGDVAPELVPAFDAIAAAHGVDVTAAPAPADVDQDPPAVFDIPPAVEDGVNGWTTPEPQRPAMPAASGLGHPGWRSRHDERSRGFAIADRLAGRAALHDVTLAAPPVLNQGKEGACVGFGVADAVNVLDVLAGDLAQLLDDADALALYHDAQKRDDVPGESYTGTSVLAGMKAGVAAGYFAGYLWAFGTRDIAEAIVQLRRPVIVGVPWYAAMYETGPGGLVTGIGAGQLVGGHCLCILGLRMKGPQGQAGPYFVWRNSWGAGYGDGGNGYVHHRDLTALLARQGEAASPAVEAQAPR